MKLFAVSIALVLAGCASANRASESEVAVQAPRCDSILEERLPVHHSVEGLEGEYRLVLIKTDSIREPTGRIEGRLYLWRTSPNDSSRSGRRPIQGDSARSFYFGTTNIDLDAAEAGVGDFWRNVKNPRREDIDPIEPPILGFVHRGVDEIGPWVWFVFAIETLGNYRDGRGGLDGPGIGLTVQQIRTDGFSGNWGRFGIVKTGSGYFCAYRVAKRT